MATPLPEQDFGPKVSLQDCNTIDPSDPLPLRPLCEALVAIQDKQDDIRTNLYITAGVLGGVGLVLLILIIILFVKFNKAFKELYDGDELQKRGFSTYTGQQVNPAFSSPPPQFSPPPAFSPGMNQSMGFDNAASGGVRVLPRNPPILRNNNF